MFSADANRGGKAATTDATKTGAKPAGADATKAGAKPAGADATKAGAKPAGADATKTGTKPAGADATKAGTKPAGTDSTKTAAKSDSAKPKMGYKLVMKVNYFGRVEWTVSPDGSRLSSPILAITCRPPLFETHLYNTETKKVKIFDKKAGFDRIGAMMEGGLTSLHSKYKYSPWKKVGEELVAGRKCTRYTRNMLNAQQDQFRYAKYVEDYWVTPYFDLPHIDDLCAPLQRMTSRNFSQMRGFGLKHMATWQVFRRGVAKPEVDDKLVYLQTLECRKELIDPKIFEMGANFTPVKDEGEILFSDDGAGFAGHF
ncbi:MAG: hypothetical protein U0103_24915 [Candidatus Obscuribacterales bacterium]